MTSNTVHARGEVAIEIGKQNHKLIPSFENIAALEDATGCGLYELAGKFREGQITLRHVGAILGVVANPPVSPEALKASIEQGGLPGVTAAIGGFLVAAITGGEEIAKKGNKKPGKKRAAKS